MATLHLTGGKTMHVSETKGQWLMDQKTKNRDKSSMIDLGAGKFMELGQIRGVDMDSMAENEVINKEQDEARKQAFREWEAEREAQKLENSEEKAYRMLRTGCFLLWKSRGNGVIGELMPKELFDDIMLIAIDYFEQHPNEIWLPADTYSHLVRTQQPKVVSKVGRLQSFGELSHNKHIL